MRLILFGVVLCVLCLAPASGDSEKGRVVAGRIELCEQCRMQQLPDVTRFLDEVVPLFESLEVVEGELGEEPTLYLLNPYREVVRKIVLSHFTSDDILRELSENGLHVWSKPTFLPKPMELVNGCVAWRQTKGCKGGAHAEREPMRDEPCFARITYDRSGYCECEGDLTVDLDCDHDEGSCQQFCARLTGTSSSL